MNTLFQTNAAAPALAGMVFDPAYQQSTEKLANLYAKGKTHQWDAATRIDWAQELDPESPLAYDDRFMPCYGTAQWLGANDTQRADLRRQYHAYTVSQFLHGEQAALMAAAKLVQVLPTIEGKQFAATQVIDEARHVELFSRLLTDKIGLAYPIDTGLQSLIECGLADNRWDMVVLTTQILIEGLALVSLQHLRDFSHHPLIQSLALYVMEDEARHVAYGNTVLGNYLQQLTAPEQRERHEFIQTGLDLLFTRNLIEGLGTSQADKMIRAKFERKLAGMGFAPAVKQSH